MNRADIHVPVIAPYMAPIEKNYPISQKENLLRAFRQEKPLWMPIITDATQWVFPEAFQDTPQGPDCQTQDGYDWFGSFYKYSAVQSGCTPMSGPLNDVTEWREKINWPDLNKADWAKGLDAFVRDPNRALSTRLGNGIFERLHIFECFEQCLLDVLLEPEECKALFDRLGDYKIECVRRMQPLWHFDYITHNDDWSNARAPFFSRDVFEAELLDSAVKLASAVHALGVPYMVHCCGRMDAWVPYLVNDIHADALEIQNINDIRAILDCFGGKTTPVYALDQYVMYDPDTTPEQARAYARSIVDKYGAHTCDGAGVVVRMHGCYPQSYYAFQDELFSYSADKYASIH